MELYYKTERCSLYAGNNLEILSTFDNETVNTIITDPPYGINFENKGWDKKNCDTFNPGIWRECYRVATKDAALLAFGSPRTWHKTAMSIEQGGWEIINTIAWLYTSGRSSSATALKPMFEPIIVARKGSPLFNIDANRIGDFTWKSSDSGYRGEKRSTSIMRNRLPRKRKSSGVGRWPGNVVIDEHVCEQINKDKSFDSRTENFEAKNYFPVFMATRKASPLERPLVRGVLHPTVKPLDLMCWLVRLAVPVGGTVLDPFVGSGTTLEAAVSEGRHSVGCEMNLTYLPLCVERLERATMPLF